MTNEKAKLCHQVFDAAAARYPDRTFLAFEDAQSTYEQVQTASLRVAARLSELGITKGDRVALLTANSPFFVECFYGVLRIGAIAVPLNPVTAGPGMRQTLLDCAARAVILDTEQTHHRAAGDLPELVEMILLQDTGETTATLDPRYRGLGTNQDAPPPVELSADDPAVLIYTSGSTGEPRGVVLSHGNITANTEAIVEYLHLSAEDRVLVVLPFSYSYGLSLLNTHAAVGASLVIENDFRFPQKALNTLEEWGCTGLSGVPSTFAILLRYTDIAERKLPTLRYVTQAGGPMSPALTRKVMAALEGCEIFIMYGASEATARLSYLPPKMLADNVGAVGIAIPGVTLTVRAPDGTEVPQGETGEVVAQGPNIMLGYWEEPEETAAVLDEHGFRTGDLGYFDEKGLLHIVGRARDMIKSGAHRISPLEIERILEEHPEVHEAAVIAQPDELLGERIAAFVAAAADASPAPDQLIAFVRERLAPHKVPSTVSVIDALPKKPNGKLDKEALRGDDERES